MTLDELLQRLDIGENHDTEFKSAEGGLPKSLWETVSAFANTDGGYIVLGIEEKKDGYAIVGVRRPETLLKTFWDAHNNPQKLNTALCAEGDVQVQTLDGRKVIVIHVPRATRTQRPIYINGNPAIGCFKRNFEGDYRCSEAEMRQMLRDASDAPQDARIFEDFDLDDLDRDSLAAYRNRFASREPDHPFLALNEPDFLERIGALRRDRKSHEEGVTLAGLLMFGRESSLLEALPHFHLDYQEKLSDDTEVRWTYRLTLDGKWEPNLFNFYYRVYPRLVDGLDVPFKLDRNAVRLGETHVHEALREALVNTLIHADHQSSRPLTVIKQRDAYIFSNPGRLRIPLETLYQGGVSDPRNPNLQKMFQLIGLGEKAGSGFQKILRAWREQPWLWPFVREDAALEMTRVTMPVANMIPEAVEQELKEIVGDAFAGLAELDRVILMLAHRFGAVGNSDVQPYCKKHPREIGEHLKLLVDRGWLNKSGNGRGTRYSLPVQSEPDLFGLSNKGDDSSQHNVASFQHSDGSIQHNEVGSPHNVTLEEIAAPVRNQKRSSRETVRETIMQLCAQDYLTLEELATLLGRASASIQNHYLIPLHKEGKLVLRYPNAPTHPAQGYKRS